MARIPNKATYYRLWRAGVLGNRPLAWDDAAALRASGYTQPVVVRSTQIGWKTLYGVSVEEALALAERVPGLTFNQCLPDEKLMIQGEVMRDAAGLRLTYTTVTKPMKLAMAEDVAYTDGIVAKMILDHFLWPSSRDDLDALWDLYPDAVIEFSTYSIAIGDQPNRNTLIWEVRDY